VKQPIPSGPRGYSKQDSTKLKEIKEEPNNDMQSLSSMVQQMSDADKKQETERFQHNQEAQMQKMKDLTQLLMR
jgi:hypothetical protein